MANPFAVSDGRDAAGNDRRADAGSDDPALAAALRTERLRLYRGSFVSALGAQLTVVPLLLGVLWESLSRQTLVWWLPVLALSLVARVWSSAPLWRAQLPPDQGALVRRQRLGVAASGAAWGLAGWLMYPGLDLLGQTFLIFVLGGMAAGSLTLLAFDLRAGLGFSVLALTPVVLRLVERGTPEALSMALMVTLFAAFLSSSGWRHQRNLNDTVAARWHDAQRAQALVTNQQRLQQISAELARKSAALQVTLDSMDQGILSIGSDGRTQFHNRRLLELADLPESLMAGRPTMDEIARYQHEQGHYGSGLGGLDEPARGVLARWLQGERKHFPERYFRRTPGGRVLEVQSRYLDDGALVRTFSDVTAFFDAQQRLQDSQAQAAKLALVAAHTEDAVAILDPDRRIEWVNDGFTRMTGYPLHEAAGRFPIQLLHAQGLDIEAVARLDGLLLQQGRCAGELRQRARDGRHYWCALEVQAIRDAEGHVTQYISISRDISARKADEQALRAARDEAERANRAKSDFLSAMSHELRTPMNAILGFAQLLDGERRQPLAGRQRDHVQQILQAGSHLLELINDVLDLARVEAGKQPIALQPVAVGPLVQECLALVRPLAQARHITLAAPARAVPEGCRVLADRTRLRQVLLNLLSNAIKYNRDGGEVRWSVAAGATGVAIAITDTGLGLDDEEQRRLFQPFERLGAEGGPVQGAGIGLALSRRLVELMQGRIEVDSRAGHGSTFSVHMRSADAAPPDDRQAQPAAGVQGDGGVDRADAQTAAGIDGVAGAASTTTAAAPGVAGPVRKVLYIEDNPVNLLLVQAALEHDAGVALSTAPLPQLGLDLALADPPDLVLLDIQLPDMDGFEVLRRLRADARTCEVPVVAVSANAMPADVERAQAAGFDGYLTKPLDIAQLRAAVHRPWRGPAAQAAGS